MSDLRQYITRVMNVLAEIDDLGTDKKEIYKEIASAGFDRTVVSQVVGHLRKKAAKPGKFAEQSALFDLYLNEFEGVGTPVATHAARDIEEIPPHDEDGVILEADPVANVGEGADGAIAAASDDPASRSEGPTEGHPVSSLGFDGKATEGVLERVPSAPTIPEPETEVSSSPSVSVAGARRADIPAAATGVPDRTKPNPICRDPSDCGVEASWNHTCLACQRIKSQSEAQVAVH